MRVAALLPLLFCPPGAERAAKSKECALPPVAEAPPTGALALPPRDVFAAALAPLLAGSDLAALSGAARWLRGDLADEVSRRRAANLHAACFGAAASRRVLRGVRPGEIPAAAAADIARARRLELDLDLDPGRAIAPAGGDAGGRPLRCGCGFARLLTWAHRLRFGWAPHARFRCARAAVGARTLDPVRPVARASESSSSSDSGSNGGESTSSNLRDSNSGSNSDSNSGSCSNSNSIANDFNFGAASLFIGRFPARDVDTLHALFAQHRAGERSGSLAAGARLVAALVCAWFIGIDLGKDPVGGGLPLVAIVRHVVYKLDENGLGTAGINNRNQDDLNAHLKKLVVAHVRSFAAAHPWLQTYPWRGLVDSVFDML